MSAQAAPDRHGPSPLQARLRSTLLLARLLSLVARGRLVRVQALVAERLPLLTLAAIALAAAAGRRWD
jgi:hypothetical protein